MLLDFLNPLSENFFVYKLIELLGELLKSLFVPSEERITALTETVSSKFDFVDSIKLSIDSLVDIVNNVGNVPTLNIELGATKYSSATTVALDFAWYKPFKPFGDLIITGFSYAMFLWRLFIKLPGIISGSSGNIEINDGHISLVSKRGGSKW